jgi:hypothetical protein
MLKKKKGNEGRKGGSLLYVVDVDHDLLKTGKSVKILVALRRSVVLIGKAT